MNKKTQNLQRWLTLLPIGAALAASTAWAQAAKPATETAASKAKVEEDTIELSPFTVSSNKDSGYFAENTLAGSRLNTNIGDLAAAISVVTKQQMEDTASLDINDVFRYEANTEGSSTYTVTEINRNTAKDTNAGYSADSGAASTNAQANRVRGLATPDAATNYYPTNNRIPFDAYNTQSVEISRGPNSLLFGLGSPAGIVNQSTAQAALNKNNATIQLRTDSYGSFRSSFSFNKSIIRDKLAITGAFLYNDQQFQRKPSSDVTRRFYGAMTFKPFKKTVIRASAEQYENAANRPNTLTPRDYVSSWLASGRPAYDPVARTVTKLDSGLTYGPYVMSTLSPGYVSSLNGVTIPVGTGALSTTTSPWYMPGIVFDNISRPNMRIDNGNVVDFFQRQAVFYTPAWTYPVTAAPTASSLGWVAQDPRYAVQDRLWTASTNSWSPTNRVLGYNQPGVTNKDIYDWTKYNALQSNFGWLRARNYNVEIEQQLLPNLFLNAGWFRQDIKSAENYTISQTTGSTLFIDTNLKMADGTTNKYFGLPYVQDSAPDTFYQPETDDNYRAMLAYDLDFTQNRGWSKWLGHHRLMGMWSEQAIRSRRERWRTSFADGDADAKLRYVSNLLVPGAALWSGSAIYRNYYLASPGDAQAKVSHSTGFYGNQGWSKPFTSNVQVYDWATQSYKYDTVTEKSFFADNGSYRFQREVDSLNFAAQSNFLEDRIVTTVGWRKDEYRARKTTTGQIKKADGTIVAAALNAANEIYHTYDGLCDYNAVMNRWNTWDKMDGQTKTIGGAFRPFKGARYLGNSVLADVLSNVTLYANRSDNFNPPATVATDYFGNPLPKPSGEGKDYGIGISMLNNKLVARINWFTTKNINERNGSAVSTLFGRVAYGDTTCMLPWATTVVRLRHGANTAVTNWNSETVNPTTSYTSEIWALMGLPYNYYSTISAAGTQQSEAKGTEVQITYNPTPGWTMKVTGGSQETVYNNVAPEFFAWEAARMPVWTTAAANDIPDFTDVGGRNYSLKNFWTSYGYTTAVLDTNIDGSTTVKGYYNNVVTSQAVAIKAQEGSPSPTQRKYRGSFITNYNFREGRLKGWGVGMGERYESRSAIGFYGKATDPTAPLQLNVPDISKPIYSPANWYTDLWVSYTRRVWRDVSMKVQLSCNNVTEDGHLQTVAVNLDGEPYAFRIIDSRSFLLTTTFNF